MQCEILPKIKDSKKDSNPESTNKIKFPKEAWLYSLMSKDVNRKDRS